METYSDCKARLDELLEEGRVAAVDNSNVKRKAVCRKLIKFVHDTDPAIPGTEELDELAFDAHDLLSIDWTEGAIANVERFTAELRAIGKQVERVTVMIEKSAATNRLTKATAAVDALQGAISALKNFDEVLKEGDDDELRAKLTEALKSVEGLKKLVEKNKEG